MKNSYAFYLCLLIFLSCQDNRTPVLYNPEIILNSFSSFWGYWTSEVRLSRDFNCYDTNGNKIEKKSFLTLIKSGEYLPVKLKSNTCSYKLYKFRRNLANKDISSILMQEGEKFYHYYCLERQQLPEFYFIDLNQKQYTNETFKGKNIIVKCWFINCQRCVQESPSFERLIDHYTIRNDVTFLSAALDTREKLKDYFTTQNTNCAVIPETRQYLFNQLGIKSYPTYIVIDKNGLIVKIVDSYAELEYILLLEKRI